MPRRKKGRHNGGGTSSVGTAPMISWEGATFRLAPKVGMMPLLTFAKLAEGGADTEDMEALAAMHDLIQQCVAEEDWARFKYHATKIRAQEEEFMAFVQGAIQTLSKDRTGKPSGSPAGQPQTSGKSEEDLHSRVAARLDGRPDLQLAVLSAGESRGAIPTRAS
jgi:hypothetical protein